MGRKKTVNLKTGQLRLVCRIERKKIQKLTRTSGTCGIPHQVYKYGHNTSPTRRENERSKKNI